MNQAKTPSKIRTFSGQLSEARQGLRELRSRELADVTGGQVLWPDQNYTDTGIDASGTPWDCD